MPKCTYCGKMYEIPRGLTLVGIDGSVKHLCSSKCRKNMKMKRRKVRWVLKSKKTKKEMLAEIKEEVAEEHSETVPLEKK